MAEPWHIGLITPYFSGVNSLGSGIGTHFRHLADGLLEAGQAVTVLIPVQAGSTHSAASSHLNVLQVTTPPLATIVGRVNWQLHQWVCERALRHAVATAAATATGVQIWETMNTGVTALHFLDSHPRAPVITRVATTASQLRATNAGNPTWLSRQHERQERRLLAGSDAVITHSESHRAEMVREFSLPAAQIQVIPLGIPLPARPKRLPRTQIDLLFVGRLELRKGIDLLLHALPAVLAALPTLRVTLVGSDSNGFWQQEWRNLAPAALRERVIFAGAISDEALARTYAQSDIFVAPSRYESFGLMFVEAMAWGLPAVALAAPGAQDVLIPGETALLTPPDNVAALAAAISTLAKDPALRLRLGQAGRERAERLYSRPALTAASLSFYGATLSRAGCR